MYTRICTYISINVLRRGKKTLNSLELNEKKRVMSDLVLYNDIWSCTIIFCHIWLHLTQKAFLITKLF